MKDRKIKKWHYLLFTALIVFCLFAESIFELIFGK